MKYALPLAAGVTGLAYYKLGSQEKRVQPATKENIEAAKGIPMPCGAEIPNFHGVKTLDFLGQWRVQKQGLLDKFDGPWRGTLFEYPALDADCCADWCRVWLEQYNKHATKEDRSEGHSKATALLGAAFVWLRDDPVKTNARMAFEALQQERAKATAADSGGTYDRLRQVIDATSRMAAALDSNIHVDVTGGLPSNVDLLRNAAGDVGAKAGDGAAWTVEKILGPIVGGAASATFGVVASKIAPYAILGGAVYYVAKRK